MAIALSSTGYCELSDVQALLQQFTIDANSDPSTAEVEAWVTEEFHLANAMLRRAGYAAPVAQGGGSLNVTSGNITLGQAHLEGNTSVLLTGTGLNGSVMRGDSLTIAGDSQPYMVLFDAYANDDSEISPSISPPLELDASSGAVVTFTAGSGAASVLKKLNALSAAIRVVPAAYSAYGDGVEEIVAPLRAERDELRDMIKSGALDLPSIAKPDTSGSGVARLLRA